MRGIHLGQDGGVSQGWLKIVIKVFVIAGVISLQVLIALLKNTYLPA
jgi:hypothetical protein